jgi:hypothetical protein
MHPAGGLARPDPTVYGAAMKRSASRFTAVFISSVLAIPAAATSAAWAQSGFRPVPTLEECAALQSDTERLACFDRVLRSGRTASPAPEPQGEESPAARPPAEAAEPVAAPAPRAAPSPARQPAPTVDDGERPVVVVAMRMRSPNQAVFTLENGDVWLQTDAGSVQHLSTVPFAARLQSGSLGSHFLAPDGGGRRIRVRFAQ